MVIVLYIFIGWVIYTIWKDLRIKSQLFAPQEMNKINLVLNEEQVFSFQQKIINIGRDPSCELLINDDTISAYHARISFHHNQWWLEDLNSTNGTYLNMEMVTKPTVLINKDEFQCGSTKISVKIGK